MAIIWIDRRILTSAVILCSLSIGKSAAFAQITGTVSGTVTNRETGAPVTGAHVSVEGTHLESTTGEDGAYVIEDAPVGLYDLTIQYLSYQTTRRNLRILAGATTRADFQVRGPRLAERTLKRAQLVFREAMMPMPNIGTFARAPSVGDIVGVGIYPYPQVLPVPGIRRLVGREEITRDRGLPQPTPDPQGSDAGKASVQPRVEVRDWPLGAPDAEDQPEAPEDKS